MNNRTILNGLKVLDLSTEITGPYAAKLLADNGAEVVKVESPIGDVWRYHISCSQQTENHELNPQYLTLNTSKKGITLDIIRDSGRQLFIELVKIADAIIENYKPDFLNSLGLSYDSLSKLNPRLVMTSISNFGKYGPFKDWEATEITFQAARGLMATIGDPERSPLKTGIALSQYLSGVTAFTSTLAAIYQAINTGEGQQVDVAMADSIMSVTLVNSAMWAMDYPEKHPRERLGARRGPLIGIYPCKDGYIGSVVVNYDQLSRLTEVISPELANMDKFGDLFWGKATNSDELEAILLPWFLDHTKDEIVKIGQERDIAWSPVSTIADLVENNPHLIERDSIIEIAHPQAGKLKYFVPCNRFSDTSYRLFRPPLRGEHNEQIFGNWLGISKTEIQQLSKEGVI